MVEIKLFEPAMCCSSGVCGPSPDQELIRVNGDIEKMKQNGIKVLRYNLTSAPNAFVRHEAIMTLIKDKGEAIMPITMINDEVVKTGSYMTTDEVLDIIVVHDLQNNCCAPGDNCC
ncbi:arsenical resistance operon transcriptional repressor ArsD [Macrococcus epidermidis]|uniref:Arsenical resistance operon transcriptional repressor ArsD n=2 Tax=Staphylococcaceae TaxID=90964 RepID=A0A328A559_9STAP|nr:MULTISPECIES: arsenite efflux transporter metallochaperone ArsD [Macrococcus]QRN49024.1 arsenite efflux transporter metallochaperone ArsD [Macrococcus bohemicus]RAK43705.1 arsenical resistance operon transcriptional repressor ArsD [Macrococcus epidermidis]RAK49609.1 arsenical resistance operon transcriptional repressor ArsD [Macrococcus bohemicus]TDL36015.1 arsenite efflux transporter metallochaperone ArsD [Macrococcus bohemicus]